MTGLREQGPGGHAEETIKAVIGDLELARIVVTQEASTGRMAVAAKLIALAGELAELAELFSDDIP